MQVFASAEGVARTTGAALAQGLQTSEEPEQDCGGSCDEFNILHFHHDSSGKNAGGFDWLGHAGIA
jgi:hypothetical protein